MGLGMPEVVLILVIALIVFGPRKLPELGKSLGQAMAQFRKASDEFKRTWEQEVEFEKVRKTDSSVASEHGAQGSQSRRPGGLGRRGDREGGDAGGEGRPGRTVDVHAEHGQVQHVPHRARELRQRAPRHLGSPRVLRL